MSTRPADPAEIDARTRASFARQPAMATIGATLVHVEPGHVVLEMAHHDTLTQPHALLHVGIVSTALYSACGYAAFTLMPPEAAVLTIEFKVNLLAPARGPRLRFEGQVTKAGRTISVVDGRAWHMPVVDGPEPGVVATMTATVMTALHRGLHG